MSTPQTQVFTSTTQTNVVTVQTPGPQGPTGPIGNPGPTGPASGPTGPTGPSPPGIAPVFGIQITTTIPSGVTDNFAPFGYVDGLTNALIFTPTDGTSALAGLSAIGVANGFTLIIFNASGTTNITLNSSASGTPANQFLLPSNANVTLLPFSLTILVYLAGFGWTT